MGNIASNSVKKFQSLIFPIVAIVVGLAVLGLVVIPQALKIPQTNAQIDQIRQNVNALNQKIGQLNGINLAQFKDDLNSSLVALPGEKDIPGAMTLVFNLLKNNGLALNGISFGVDSTSGTNTMFLVKVDVSGTKDGLVNFITQLKQSPRVMKVDNLTTTTSATDSKMEILIGLNAFYQQIPPSQSLDINQPITLPNQQNKDTLAQIKGYQAQNGNLIQDATSSGVTLGKPDPFQ